MKRLFLMIGLLFLAGCSSAKSESQNSDIKEYTQDIFAMDTYMTITGYGDQAEQAVAEAIQVIEHYDDLWSVGNESSEISVLNKQGVAEVSDETLEVLEKSLDLYDKTKGKFDITIGPLMEEWGFTNQNYHVPDQERLQEILAYVGSNRIHLDASNHTIQLDRDVNVDLGAIAKGYTSNKIMEIFEKYDLVSGMVSLGGNVQVYGKKPDQSLWRVGIENPDASLGQLENQDYIGQVEVSDKAVITSGGYERNFEENGKIYHHILDPDTGYPSESDLISVTIVSEDGCLADGLSTSLFVMGKEKAICFWEENSKDFDAILIDDQGQIWVTKGIEDIFSSDLTYEIVE